MVGAAGEDAWGEVPGCVREYCDKLEQYLVRSGAEVLEIAEHFNAKVVDYAPESVILRVYGSSEKLDAMVSLFTPEQIVDLVRSGKIVMARALEMT